MAETIEEAHPYVLYRGVGTGALWHRQRIAEDYEDLDSLPVEEQAAILCSVIATDIAGWRDGYGVDQGPGPHRYEDLVSEEAGNLASNTYMLTAIGNWGDQWAEAEARIRNGEVNP